MELKSLRGISAPLHRVTEERTRGVVRWRGRLAPCTWTFQTNGTGAATEQTNTAYFSHAPKHGRVARASYRIPKERGKSWATRFQSNRRRGEASGLRATSTLCSWSSARSPPDLPPLATPSAATSRAAGPTSSTLDLIHSSIMHHLQQARPSQTRQTLAPTHQQGDGTWYATRSKKTARGR